MGRHKGHCLENIIMGYCAEMAREEQHLQSSALPAELSKKAPGAAFTDWVVSWVLCVGDDISEIVAWECLGRNVRSLTAGIFVLCFLSMA